MMLGFVGAVLVGNLKYMSAGRPAKDLGTSPLLVVILACGNDLERARRMRRPPDLFELRLDALYHDLPQLEASLSSLRAPLIITARHSAEGGVNNLTLRQRRDTLLRFLSEAAYVDVELRSAAELRSVLRAARRRRIGWIVSFHDFRRTPGARELAELAQSAAALRADILKVAIRTDTAKDVARLLEFFRLARKRISISAMGIGKCGRSARRKLIRLGSTLNYAPLGSAQVDGQLSLREMRRALEQ